MLDRMLSPSISNRVVDQVLMVRFGRVAPTIPVTNIDRALRFYRDVLGFVVAFTNGDPVSFAAITQGDAELHLSVQPDQAGLTHAHLMVDDLDDIHDVLLQAGIPIRQAPTIQSWGLRDLVVADPDGNSLEIAEPVSKRAPA
jgi:catechol 2,3-dioxygenase-like lactoylglutathione lyase family enzyme